MRKSPNECAKNLRMNMQNNFQEEWILHESRLLFEQTMLFYIFRMIYLDKNIFICRPCPRFGCFCHCQL